MKTARFSFASHGRLVPPLAAALLLVSPAAARAQATIVDIATDATDPSNLPDDEPSIAVDRMNPLRIAVVTFSESWTATRGAPVWRSDDGGMTWRKVFQIPRPTPTASGPGDRKIAFDALGRLHSAELTGSLTAFMFRQTSEDPDAPLSPGQQYGNDQPHLDVDKSPASMIPFQAYSPFLNFSLSPEQSSVAFSSNQGANVTTVGVGVRNFPNRTTRTALGPDGSAYIVYKTREGTFPGDTRFELAHFRVHRSDNGGASWSANGLMGVSVHGAPQVRTWFTNNGFGNPAKGKTARARSSDAWIAVDPGDGDVYVTYCDRDASGLGQVYLARSADRGVTWTTTRVTDGTRHSAFPHVAVADNGAVGVLYTDFDDSGPRNIYRHRFARSFDDGATWTDQTLQSFNPDNTPNARPSFLWGDYQGLTAVGLTFYGVFTGDSTDNRRVRQFDPIFFKETAAPPGAEFAARRSQPTAIGSEP